MGLFPFIDNTKVNIELPLLKEYAWENGEFLLKNGKMYIVEGKDALKIWIYKALKTSRYVYLAYSWNFGHELDNLIGSGFSKSAIESEAKRYIQEALLVSPYILSVDNLVANFTGDDLTLTFTVNTIYGEVEINV